MNTYSSSIKSNVKVRRYNYNVLDKIHQYPWEFIFYESTTDSTTECSNNIYIQNTIINFEEETPLIYLDKDDTCYSYGGELELEDLKLDTYSLSFGGKVNIENISPKQMIELAKNIVNHLISNGHNFKIEKVDMSNYPELIDLN